MGKWKENNWDKWSFWGKTWHVIKVILSLTSVLLMFIVTAWFVLTVLGLGQLVYDLRDKILLDIMHSIFG